MTVINSLSLNAQQEQSFVKKIKERVIAQYNLEAEFDNLKAHTMDFTSTNISAFQEMEDTLGQQIIVPVKTADGSYGEVQYLEVNGAWFYNVAVKTQSEVLINGLRNISNSDKNFNKLKQHLIEKGYTLNLEEDYVIQNVKHVESNGDKPLTKIQNSFVIPVYENENEIGALVIDEELRTSAISIGEERTIVNENGEILTIKASCSLKWMDCMSDCLPGCDDWKGCLLLFGSCLAACCACSTPACIICVSCVIVGAYCLWTCRMCVSGASRPGECPN